MAETLTVQIRENHGKRNARRLRRSGTVPAVLYGHGEKPVSLAVAADQLATAVRRGSRLVNLKGAVTESALIRETQYDVYGHEVLHVDFARVSADERIHVEVSIELRGQSAGVKNGGVIEHVLHEVEIECLATAIPDKLQLNITNLDLEQEIKAGEIPLPEGVKLLSNPDELVVHCIKPLAEEGEEAPSGEGAEPEVIGRKAAEEGEGEEAE